MTCPPALGAPKSSLWAVGAEEDVAVGSSRPTFVCFGAAGASSPADSSPAAGAVSPPGLCHPQGCDSLGRVGLALPPALCSFGHHKINVNQGIAVQKKGCVGGERPASSAVYPPDKICPIYPPEQWDVELVSSSASFEVQLLQP